MVLLSVLFLFGAPWALASDNHAPIVDRFRNIADASPEQLRDLHDFEMTFRDDFKD